MTNYNSKDDRRREVLALVMSRAHALKKQSEGAIFSECLKEAWKEALECPICGEKHHAGINALNCTCNSCFAMYTPLGGWMEWGDLRHWLKIDECAPKALGRSAYYDFAIGKDVSEITRRVHGWYCVDTRRVIQYG